MQHTAMTFTLQHTGVCVIAINTWPLTTAHVKGRSSRHLFQCQQTQVHEGTHRNILQLKIEQIDRSAGTQTVIQHICNCLYTFHAHPQCPPINAHVEKTCNCICDCTGLQTTYAHKRYININLYSNNQYITWYIQTNDVTQGNTYVRGTHTQAMPFSLPHTLRSLSDSGAFSPVLDWF